MQKFDKQAREQARLRGEYPTFLELEEFEDKFRPKENHNSSQRQPGVTSIGNWMYETYGDDLDVVREAVEDGTKGVWTVLDCDGEMIIANGYHRVNRVGYILTTVIPDENLAINVMDGDDHKFEIRYFENEFEFERAKQTGDHGNMKLHVLEATHEESASQALESQFPHAVILSVSAVIEDEEDDDDDDLYPERETDT